MAAKVKPSRNLLRRHAAAMKIIHEIPRDERLGLLTAVVLGSPRLDEVCDAAEAVGRPMPRGRQRAAA
jgi:hypothetical protein